MLSWKLSKIIREKEKYFDFFVAKHHTIAFYTYKLLNIFMKNLLGLFAAVAIMATTFTACNKNDDYDYAAEIEAAKKEEQKLDSLFAAQKLIIEDYVEENFTNPIQDTVTYRFAYIDKKITRGIYYQIDAEPIDNSYEYKGQMVNSMYGAYFAPILPKVKLKYSAKLLNGTVVGQETTGSDFDLSTMNNTIFNNAWQIAFLPYSIQYNGETKVFNGLTRNGLKKGSKIKMITPSPWAFHDKAVGTTIPANSILIYEFEILEIQ